MTITKTHWKTDSGKRWSRSHTKYTGDAGDRAELESHREVIRQDCFGRDISLTPVTDLPDGTIELVFSSRDNEG